MIMLDMLHGGADTDTFRSYVSYTFSDYEKVYGSDASPDASLAVRFNAIIKAAYNQTGQQVAILIDEYDSPLQHSWHTPEHEACTALYREVFAILKADDEMERFVFITGITKITQNSLFSGLNNLMNISFEPQYAAICGITKQEIVDNFMPEVEQMAQRLRAAKLLTEGMTYSQVIEQTNISSATLSRVSRCVQYGTGYRQFVGQEE